MKTEILQLNPILIASINEQLEARYRVHRLFKEVDKEGYVAMHGRGIRAVITGGHTGISNALMDQLPALQVVAINGVGTDAVDLNYARARGIAVTATLGALTDDVADLAIGLLIGTCRGMFSGDRFVREGKWPENPQPSAIPLARRFSGMNVGIVGMGRVGRAIATRAAAFGCAIRYNDLRSMPDVPYEYVSTLKNLALSSDALVLAAAADQAEGIVNREILNALGCNGFIVNIARGKLINEADLVSALVEKRIAGAGLDVFVDEPNVPPALFQMDNVSLQAHRASATIETRTRMGEMVLTSLEQALNGLKPEGSLTT